MDEKNTTHMNYDPEIDEHQNLKNSMILNDSSSNTQRTSALSAKLFQNE